MSGWLSLTNESLGVAAGHQRRWLRWVICEECTTCPGCELVIFRPHWMSWRQFTWKKGPKTHGFQWENPPFVNGKIHERNPAFSIAMYQITRGYVVSFQSLDQKSNVLLGVYLAHPSTHDRTSKLISVTETHPWFVGRFLWKPWPWHGKFMDSPHALSMDSMVIEVPDGSRNRASNNSQAVASFFNISASEAIQLGNYGGEDPAEARYMPSGNLT